MALFEPGRLCVKLAGRDAGKKCVIVDTKNGKYLIDGETRRRMCNARHLEPLKERVDIKKGASHADVTVAFKKLGMELIESKPRKKGERPKKTRVPKSVKRAPKKPTTEKKEAAPTAAPKADEKKAEPAAEKKTLKASALAEPVKTPEKDVKPLQSVTTNPAVKKTAPVTETTAPKKSQKQASPKAPAKE